MAYLSLYEDDQEELISAAPIDVPEEQPAVAKQDAYIGLGDSPAIEDDGYVGLGSATEPEEDYGILDIAQDVGVSLGAGVNSLVKVMGDAYGLATGDMDNFVSRYGQYGVDDWNKLKSDTLKGMEAARDAKVAAADSEMGKAGTAFWETVSNPLLMTSFIAEQAPMFLPIGAAGRAAGIATKAAGVGAKGAARARVAGAIGTGAAMQGADAGTQAFDQLMALPEEVWDLDDDVRLAEDREQAKKDKALSLSRDAAIASGIVSVGLNAIPGAKVLEKSLAGVKLPTSKLANTAKGFFGESLSEAGEEGFGVIAANIATQQIDPTQETFAGAGEAAGMGAAAGPFGAIAGANGVETPVRNRLEQIAETIGPATSADEVIAASNQILTDALPGIAGGPGLEDISGIIPDLSPDLLRDPEVVPEAELEAIEPGSRPLEDIQVFREYEVDGELTRIAESAQSVITEMDTRIDGLKKLIACVGT